MHHAIFDTFPALAHAKQPPKLERVNGSFSFNPAEDFAHMVRRVESNTFRLRAPESHTERLVGPFRGTGTCLRPVLFENYTWIDPTMEPADGDFVLVSLDPEELAGIIERGKDDPEWIATYGPNPGPVVVKILRSIGHQWYLSERKTCFPLTGFRAHPLKPRNNRVLGVVRAVMDMRTGKFLYDAPLARAIGQNAATYTVVNNSNVSGNVSGVTGLQNLGIVVNPSGPNGDATVIVTATIQCEQVAGTLGDAKVLVRFADDGVTYSSSAQQLPITSSSFQTYTLQWQFSHVAANAGHGQAGIWLDMGSTADSVNWQF
ncbi:MAG: hypothetical protein ACYDAE_25280, partial [Steroidobacteraceae bacterium]